MIPFHVSRSAPGVTLSTGPQTDTLVRPELQRGSGEGEHRSHIVKRPPDRESAEAWVTEARVMGFEVEALCGFVWVPARNPEKYPICEMCRDLLSNLPV